MNVLDIKISLDVNHVEKGDYFVPLCKNKLNTGYDDVAKAIYNGAVGIIEEDELFEIVKDKLEIIGPKVIAITGSIGKSTTSHFLFELLKDDYNIVHISQYNICKIAQIIMNCVDASTEVLLCEVSVEDKVDTLKSIGELIDPDIAIILNINSNTDHLKFFNSIDEIALEKIKLLNTVKKNGFAYVNSEDPIITKNLRSYYKGDGELVYFPNDIYNNFETNFKAEPLRENLALAFQIAVEQFGIDRDVLIDRLKYITPMKGRLNALKGINDLNIIDDTYNISDVSLVNSIDYINERFVDKMKFLVVGGIDDINEQVDSIYEQATQKMDIFDKIFVVGELAKMYLRYLPEDKYLYFDSANQAGEYIKSTFDLSSNTVILFKGGDDVKLEYAIAPLINDKNYASQLLNR